MISVKRMLPGITLIAALLLCGGCYTLLSHPEGGDRGRYPKGGSYSDNENRPRSCRDCHDNAQYHHPRRLTRWGSRYIPYRRYYRPWWYDNYWYRDDYYSWYPDYYPDYDGDYEPGTNSPPIADWWSPRRKRNGEPPLQPLIDLGDDAEIQDDTSDINDQGEANDTETEVKKPRKKRRGKGRR
ncbi:MAG: hypothetical protein GY835_21375 [bacterium]|nr:hypothetical protein [bacterium]